MPQNVNLERCSEAAINVLLCATQEALSCRTNAVDSSHILLALLSSSDSVGAQLMKEYGVTYQLVHQQTRVATMPIQRTLPRVSTPFEQLLLTPDASRLLEVAEMESTKLGCSYVGVDHLFLGLLNGELDTKVAVILQTFNINLADISVLLRKGLSTMKQRLTESAVTVCGDLLSQESERVMTLAAEEAFRTGQESVGSEQILLGLAGDEVRSTSLLLRQQGLSLTKARAVVDRLIGFGSGAVKAKEPLTPQAMELIQSAQLESIRLGHQAVEPADIMLAVVSAKRGIARQVLSKMRVNIGELRRMLTN
jgi:ATP-dependent Clp protease ATP-binding subunit ClpA